jgi:hypothetical protein
MLQWSEGRKLKAQELNGSRWMPMTISRLQRVVRDIFSGTFSALRSRDVAEGVRSSNPSGAHHLDKASF